MKDKKWRLPKIDSNHYGGAWLGIGITVAVVIPFIIFLFTEQILWWMVIAGGVILLAFVVLFLIEMNQDNGNIPYYEKNLTNEFQFDPEKQYAVIRCSICTGEQVAGFKNYSDGHFTEVMVIRNAAEEARFKERFGIKTIKKEY